jgi:hypothetical protein
MAYNVCRLAESFVCTVVMKCVWERQGTLLYGCVHRLLRVDNTINTGTILGVEERGQSPKSQRCLRRIFIPQAGSNKDSQTELTV